MGDATPAIDLAALPPRELARLIATGTPEEQEAARREAERRGYAQVGLEPPAAPARRRGRVIWPPERAQRTWHDGRAAAAGREREDD